MRWRAGIGEQLQKHGKLPLPKAHGWWYHWHHLTTIKNTGSQDGPIAILAPGFHYGGPHRIIALPEERYKRDRRRFPEYSAAIAVSSEPRIIEGIYRPDQDSWAMIKKWIILNTPALTQEILLF